MSSSLVEQIRAAIPAARKPRDTARTPQYPTPAHIGNRIAREVLAG